MYPIPWPQPKVTKCAVAETWLTELEHRYVDEALSSNWIGPNGDFNQRVESKLTEILEQKTLLVSNGSVALMLALRSIGIGSGDEVLVPDLTYAATASSVVNVGATPVFCDVDPEGWGISITSMQKMITKKTKAIIVVHLYGVPANIEKIVEFAKANKLLVIEDCAEALLATQNSRIVGTFGDVSTFSFFANKLITSGEGGAVSTNNEEIYKKMNLLRGQGMDPQHRYFFLEPGYNFRLTNIQSAILLGQIERINEIKSTREVVEESYRVKLEKYITNQIVPINGRRTPWIFTTRLNNVSIEKKVELAGVLAASGMETRPVFPPLSGMPAFEKFTSDDCITSSIIATQGISLPTGHHVENSILNEICGLVTEVLSNA